MNTLTKKACDYATRTVEEFVEYMSNLNTKPRAVTTPYRMAELALSLDIITAYTSGSNKKALRIELSDGAVVYAPNASMYRKVNITYGDLKETLSYDVYTVDDLSSVKIVASHNRPDTAKSFTKVACRLEGSLSIKEAIRFLEGKINEVSMNEFGVPRSELLATIKSLDKAEVPEPKNTEEGSSRNINNLIYSRSKEWYANEALPNKLQELVDREVSNAFSDISTMVMEGTVSDDQGINHFYWHDLIVEVTERFLKEQGTELSACSLTATSYMLSEADNLLESQVKLIERLRALQTVPQGLAKDIIQSVKTLQRR